jgi:hypothetical protein
MPLIETPTVRRAVSEISSHFTLKGTITVVLWAIVAFSIVAGFAYTNGFVFVGVIVGMLWLFASYFFLVNLWHIKYIYDWLAHDVDRHTARRNRRYEYEHSDDKITLGKMTILFVIPVLILFVSSCGFWDSTDTATVVNGNHATGRNTFIVYAVPFFQTIRSIHRDQTVHFDAIATTADGHKVRGTINAQLRLSSDEEQILWAGRQSDPDAAIQDRMKKAFEFQFRQEVTKQSLTDLKPNLALEYNTSTGANRNLLQTVGVEWNGTISVSEIRPYLGDE